MTFAHLGGEVEHEGVVDAGQFGSGVGEKHKVQSCGRKTYNNTSNGCKITEFWVTGLVFQE